MISESHRKRLVISADKWRWSSFRWLVQGKRDNEAMRVDDWDEATIAHSAPGEEPRAVRDLH